MEFRTLIVDDEETYATSLKRLLARRGVRADVAGTFADGLAMAKKQRYDLVVLDYMLPDGNGLDLIEPLRAQRPAPTVLMMTAFGTIENAVEAMRRGAADYVTKSTELPAIVERVVEAERVARARVETESTAAIVAEEAAKFSGLLGESASIKEALRRIAEVAKAPDTTVLLTGESGTGKGVAARAIHALSARSKEPFVAIDCVALPATLAESELFGHEKGAFTGATDKKPGKLEVAGKGSVLLDEVGDMDPALQGKLLRVLEERTFERVGGVKPIEMGARVISASHRDLGALVEENKFRLDLYHRLSVFPIAIAPLRARGEDVIVLANHFIDEYANRMAKKIAHISSSSGAEVRAMMLAYDWPGNVRELKNVVERAVILAATEVTPELLPERMRGSSRVGGPIKLGMPESKGGLMLEFRPGQDTLDDLERRLLEEALRMAGGKKSKAAEILGISRFALLRRVEKFGLS
ncbi:MAG TPA: sigma-54 dependent transcriptional regulator [Polyangia bacterium]|nr:sigma-54 dependent transcriptional regulator [Polyangia bacterium]